MKVRYTLAALDDLDAIADYVAEDSPRAAKRVLARISDAIGLLATFPSSGIQTNDPTYRRMTISPYPYLVYYEVGDGEIIIHMIRHGARDPSNMPGAV